MFLGSFLDYIVIVLLIGGVFGSGLQKWYDWRDDVEIEVFNDITSTESHTYGLRMLDGGYLILFRDSSDNNLYKLLLDESMNILGLDMVNNDPSGWKGYPSASLMSDGGYFIVWTSSNDPLGNGQAVFGKKYFSNHSVSCEEFEVNEYYNDDQHTMIRQSVAGLVNGTFVVTWVSFQDGSYQGSYGRIFDEYCNRLGSEIHISSGLTQWSQIGGGVSSYDKGKKWVSVFQSNHGSSSIWGIYACFYDMNGNQIGTRQEVEVQANNGRSGDVTDVGNGEILVVWTSYIPSSTIYGRRYNYDGSPVGSRFAISSTNVVTMRTNLLFNNSVIVSWEDLSGDLPYKAKIYDGDFLVVRDTFQLNAITSGTRDFPNIIPNYPVGCGFTALWVSNHEDASYGIYARRTFECEYRTEVCSSHGIYTLNHCTCNDHYFGRFCNITTCNGVFNNDTTSSSVLCSGRGSCDEYNKCTCDDHYFGRLCNVTKCGNLWNNDTENVCSTHGTCDLRTRICNCTNSNYTGDYCEKWDCFGISRNDGSSVCSGFGKCLKHDKCQCVSVDYYGNRCQYWSCHNHSVHDLSVVCGGHGLCVASDTCFCLSGYGSIISKGDCTEWNCGLFVKEDGRACNGRGSCVSAHKCNCRNKYEGSECQTWSCGFEKDDPLVCSSHGKCKNPSKCKCNSGYYGKRCEKNNIVAAVLAPLLSVGGVGVAVGAVCIFFCCFLFVVLWILVIAFLTVFGLYQATKMKKYGQLKNFDILLKEQEIENDMTVAHLRINKELFEIPFSEIRVERMLGEGGSNSVVFQAIWQSQVVAFKCFKTRLICSSQDSFDEFEREVEVLASLSHPYIVKFFGATLQKPRVGIVMEFCSNGDLVQFLTRRNAENPDNKYSINNKIRNCIETASAMEFLHKRNIIHRDLKLENVLLDESQSAKLMDFGLSTIVERMSCLKTTRIGTNLYMAPEVLNESKYTEKCDIFSFGVFIFILMTEIWEPYGEDTLDVHIEVKVASDPHFRPPLAKYDEMIPKNTSWLRDLMVACWSHSADNRPSFQEILEELKEKTGDDSSIEYLKRTISGDIDQSDARENNEEEEDERMKLLLDRASSLEKELEGWVERYRKRIVE